MAKKIKIFIDHQIFSFQNYGGISRVFTELCKEFKNNNSIEYELPILFSNNEYMYEIQKVSKFFPRSKSFVRTAIMYLINRIYSTFKLLKNDFDIFQPTYYDPYFLPFLKKKPFVLLIHDMTHEIFPEGISKKDKTIEWKKKLVEKADHILAISENTKRDVIEFYNVPKEKIDVVYWATSVKIPEKIIDLGLPKRYILYTSNRGKYKNFAFFFKSIVNILKEDKDLYLVCAGSSKFNEEELELFKKNDLIEKVKHIRWSDNDNDKEMASIYNKALVFVFPSLYEGFGIPLLEAFACNCPAVVSNTSSLPEVGGDAVEYFDPKDKKSIEDAVRRVVYDKNLSEELKKRGRERLKMFSWEKAAAKFVEVYKNIFKQM